MLKLSAISNPYPCNIPALVNINLHIPKGIFGPLGRKGAFIRVAFAVIAFLAASYALGRDLRPGFSIGKEFAIRSEVLAEDRTYWVSLPASYEISSQHRYPVLYVLDAEANFNIAASMVDFMSFGTYGNNTQIPELIVVAIANTNRIRDMTPTHSKKGQDGRTSTRYDASGGADPFLDFLEKELVPNIDATYRTLPHRTLAGHSLAGLLTGHAFLTRPALFQAHVVIDPSLWWDDEVLIRRLTAWRRQSTDLNAVYVSLANNPDIGVNDPKKVLRRGRKFGRLLKANSGPQVRTSYRYFKDEDHAAVPLMSVYHGLQFVFEGFAPPAAKVMMKPAVLKEHFERVHRKLGVRVLPTEAFLDQTGSFLLYGMQELDKAYEVFTFYESIYPTAYAPPASLGDIFFEKGDLARAAEYYKKAQTLNPKDEYVPSRIKALEKKIQDRTP